MYYQTLDDVPQHFILSNMGDKVEHDKSMFNVRKTRTISVKKCLHFDHVLKGSKKNVLADCTENCQEVQNYQSCTHPFIFQHKLSTRTTQAVIVPLFS